MYSPSDLTIEKAIKLLDDKAITHRDLIEQYLNRIYEVEPSVRAFSYIKEKKDVIKSLSNNVKNNNNKSPLLGIPYGLKDIIHVKDLPLEAGSKTMEGYISDKNATIFNRLNTAGAVLIGKTTTAEFASGGGAPKTRNPWNLEHTPGGSSSGSAAAISSNMLLFSIGTQTSGSVLRPASYNGITALKPTFGQISKAGIIPASWSVDCVGIFTKNVRDLKYVYNEIAGYDILDHYTYPYQNIALKLSEGNLLKKFTIGIISNSYFKGSEDVMAIFEDAIKALKIENHSVHNCKMPPSFEEANKAHEIVVNAETAAYHQLKFNEGKELFSIELRDDIEIGSSYSAIDYLQAQENRWEYKKSFKSIFENFDLLITPATTETAPKGIEKTGSPKFNKPFSNAGLPTLTLPIGTSSLTNLPVGIQIIANFDCEQNLIDLGEQLQIIFDYTHFTCNLDLNS